MKGTPSPSEYETSSTTPETRVARAADSVRTPPRTGPIQGVHPKANAIPMTSGAHGPSFDGSGWKRRSRWNSAGVPIPASQSPSSPTTIPDPISNARSCSASSLPESRDGRPESGEHERETEDERRDADEHRSQVAPLRALEVRRRQPGHHRHVTGNERKDARGEERQHARAESDENAERVG